MSRNQRCVNRTHPHTLQMHTHITNAYTLMKGKFCFPDGRRANQIVHGSVGQAIVLCGPSSLSKVQRYMASVSQTVASSHNQNCRVSLPGRSRPLLSYCGSVGQTIAPMPCGPRTAVLCSVCPQIVVWSRCRLRRHHLPFRFAWHETSLA